MASRFPPPTVPSAYTAPLATPHTRSLECDICGERQAHDPSDAQANFARRYAVVHTARGHRVQEDYVCSDCGTAFLVGARIRANLAEEEG